MLGRSPEPLQIAWTGVEAECRFAELARDIVGVRRFPPMEDAIERLVLFRCQDNGTALILQRAGPNSILAEASLYSASYHCAARAEVAAVTWAIPRAGLLARIEEDAELAIVWARHLAHEVQQARLQSEILSLKTVAARLDAWVSWHRSLPARGHWSTLAHEIGVSPEALYREIALRRRRDPP